MQPGDTAAYRIAVTRLDQESAEVLMEIVGGSAPLTGTDGQAGSGARSRTTGATPDGDGRLGQHRDAAHPAGPVPAGGVDEHRSERPRPSSTARSRGRRSSRPAATQLVQAAERQPGATAASIATVLAELGAWELDPRRDADELEAAAAAVPGAGCWALPYPVAERLARPADLDVDGLAVVSATRPAAPAAWLELRLGRGHLDGRRRLAAATPSADGLAGPLAQASLITDLALTPADDDGADDAPLSLVLPCWTLLGMLDRAMT